jgi:hypothetical protein
MQQILIVRSLALQEKLTLITVYATALVHQDTKIWVGYVNQTEPLPRILKVSFL